MDWDTILRHHFTISFWMESYFLETILQKAGFLYEEKENNVNKKWQQEWLRAKDPFETYKIFLRSDGHVFSYC